MVVEADSLIMFKRELDKYLENTNKKQDYREQTEVGWFRKLNNFVKDNDGLNSLLMCCTAY